MEEKTKRFFKVLDTLDVSGYKLSKQSNLVTQQKLTNARNGRNNISTDIVMELSRLYEQVNPNYIINGEGSMFLTGDITQSGENNQLAIAGGSVNGSNNINNSTAREVKPYLREELVNIPYVSIDAKASFVESLYDNTYEEETYGVMSEDGENLNNIEYKVFQIDGDSMTPSIPDKSKVLARIIPDTKWEEASGVVLVVYSKTLTIKRVLKNSLFDKNFITLKADNPIHGQVDVERKEIRGMWQAIRIVSQRII